MKKIFVVTERRADYSKFRPILSKIKESKNLDYCLIVTGTHLLKEHGNTIKEIQDDGFKITSKFRMYDDKHTDTGTKMTRAFSKAIYQITALIEKNKPDLILCGFDIGANLASAIVGAHLNIPVAHLEGGDVSGTIDESIRHATTKFSHIHFTTNSLATKRLIKMGENSKFIFTVGNPSLDEILKVKNIEDKLLEKEFNLDLGKPLILILQHTVTSEIDVVDKNILKTIKAIKELDIQAFIIFGNADAGSAKIHRVIRESKIQYVSTIPFKKYIHLLKSASALVGNSSSGIMEAPFLHIPSVNIGTRQNGRLKAVSIISVDYDTKQIKCAIKKCIDDNNFLKKVKKQKSLYGDGHSSERIIKILNSLNLKSIPIQKRLTY